jgi:hypothetical protein
LAQSQGGWKVRLSVHNHQGSVKSSNVIGVITGEVEPDRYVIVGNHRDAWGGPMGRFYDTVSDEIYGYNLIWSNLSL